MYSVTEILLKRRLNEIEYELSGSHISLYMRNKLKAEKETILKELRNLK